tara:strand:+ start:256 stop:516 length:261 start_codon:yes stop_codon:yes gene_type:complete
MKLKNIPTEKLQEELNRREYQETPKVLENIDWFPVIELAEEIKSEVANGSYEDYQEEEDSGELFELVMETIYGKNYWDWHYKNIHN